MKYKKYKRPIYFCLFTAAITSFSLATYFSRPNVNNSIYYISATRHEGNETQSSELKTKFSNNTNLTPQQLGFKLVPIGDENDGIYIKVPDFSLNQKGANEILKTYASLPSNIITSSPKLKEGVNLVNVPTEADLPELTDEEGDELDGLLTEEETANESTDKENTAGVDIDNIEPIDQTNLSTSYYDNLALNNIFSILEVDRTKYKWFFSNINNAADPDAPVAYNLANRSTYLFSRQNNTNTSTTGINELPRFSLVNNESLPAFDLASNNNQIVLDQNYLDTHGVLAIQLVLSEITNSSNKKAFYILLAGFNVRLNNNSNGNRPILANADYLNSVNSISDDTLLNALAVESNATNPTNKTVSQDSRINNAATGSIDLNVNFDWTVPEEIKFRDNFPGVTSIDALVGTQGIALTNLNQIRVNSSWNKSYTFSGFVAASAFNNQQTLVLASSLSVGLLAALLLTYLIVYLVRRYIAKR